MTGIISNKGHEIGSIGPIRPEMYSSLILGASIYGPSPSSCTTKDPASVSGGPSLHTSPRTTGDPITVHGPSPEPMSSPAPALVPSLSTTEGLVTGPGPRVASVIPLVLVLLT